MSELKTVKTELIETKNQINGLPTKISDNNLEMILKIQKSQDQMKIQEGEFAKKIEESVAPVKTPLEAPIEDKKLDNKKPFFKITVHLHGGPNASVYGRKYNHLVFDAHTIRDLKVRIKALIMQSSPIKLRTELYRLFFVC